MKYKELRNLIFASLCFSLDLVDFFIAFYASLFECKDLLYVIVCWKYRGSEIRVHRKSQERHRLKISNNAITANILVIIGDGLNAFFTNIGSQILCGQNSIVWIENDP